jgi:hypothetical protein
LFDLEEDPDELTNFYGHEGYEDISEDLTRRLDELMNLAKDPLLNEDEIRKWLN